MKPCPICGVPFSLIRREHKCCKCLNAVCKSCGQKKHDGSFLCVICVSKLEKTKTDEAKLHEDEVPKWLREKRSAGEGTSKSMQSVRTGDKPKEMNEIDPDLLPKWLRERRESASEKPKPAARSLKDKTKRKEKPTDPNSLSPEVAEIQRRLDALRDKSPCSGTECKPDLVFDVEKRSEEEEILDLLNKTSAKAGLEQEESSASNVDEIEERLAKLRGMKKEDLSHSKNLDRIEAEQAAKDSDEEAKDLVERYTAEAKLSDELTKSDEDESEGDDDDEDFCGICSNPPVIRCDECDDIYCKRCFKEAHVEWDCEDHLAKPYKKKTKSKTK